MHGVSEHTYADICRSLRTVKDDFDSLEAVRIVITASNASFLYVERRSARSVLKSGQTISRG
jgi:hypothetical protein